MDFITDSLQLEQIETRFPDALLILSDINWKVVEGNLVIESARVKSLCDTAEELSHDLAVLKKEVFQGDFPTIYIPYKTGVTQFHNPVGVVYVNDEKMIPLDPYNPQNVVRKVIVNNHVRDAQPPFPFSAISQEDYVSIKDLDYNPLYRFFLHMSIPKETASKLIKAVQQSFSIIPAYEFNLDVFYSVVIEELNHHGYKRTDLFNALFAEMINNEYSRLVTRNNVVVFGSSDKLKGYCVKQSYNYSVIESKGFNKLLLMLLEDKVQKVVISTDDIENLSQQKVKLLEKLAVKCEVQIEVLDTIN